LISLLLCTGIAFAADLQTALKETAEQFSASLKPKSVVAIIGIHSESPVLSDFMLDELTLRLVQLKKLTIADRANLEAIKKEMSFQLSGEVGDESIQQLGAKIGAETVIQGTVKQLGKSARYTLTIRALDVTTAAVTDMYRANVEPNEIEASMLGVKAVNKTNAPYSVGSVGFQNLLFGLGSYRTGHPGDGAVLTVGHIVGWGCFFAGIGLWTAGDSAMASLRRESEQADQQADRERNNTNFIGMSESDIKNIEKQWQEARDRRKNDEATRQEALNKQIRVGIAFLSVGVIVEVGSFIYGFVAPAVHLKRARANAVAANDTGFKFNLAYTSSENIAPQISYKIRY
jgi:hypothetical protein